MGTAVVLVGYVGMLVGYEWISQQRLSSAWNHDHPAASIPDAKFSQLQATGLNLRPHLGDGQPLARIVIPSVNFSAIVTEGSDRGFLTSGPGHDNRTGYPDEGRLVLIGNHNGFSFSWDGIKTGDAIVIEMSYGRYRYTVTKRYIVDGDDTSVISRLSNRPGETLAISTCWPLWQGAFARQRLVFEAVPVQGDSK
jgi:LPXTG-site transpeptidase (sortase) family protein